MSDLKQDAEREHENIGVFFKNIGWFFSVIGTIIALIAWTGFLAIVSVCERLWHVEQVRRVDKKQFWEHVIKCLMEFHGKSFDEAMQLVSRLRYSKNPKLYLSEPFRVANELACNEIVLDINEYRERYLKGILGKQ